MPEFDPARVLHQGTVALIAPTPPNNPEDPSRTVGDFVHRLVVLDRSFVLTCFAVGSTGPPEALARLHVADRDVVMRTLKSDLPAPHASRIFITHPIEGTWEISLPTDKSLVEWIHVLALAVHGLVLPLPSAMQSSDALAAEPPAKRPLVIPSSTLTAALLSPTSVTASHHTWGEAPASSLERHYIRQASAARLYLERLSRRMQIIEIVAGMGLLNFLLILILNSSPSHIEAWLFIGSVDILIGWTFLVRFEQLVFGVGGAGPSGQHSLNSTDDGSSSDDEIAPSAPVKPTQPPARHIAGNLPLASAVLPPSPAKTDGVSTAADDLASSKRLAAHTWSRVPASEVQVRTGPDYAIEKRHTASKPELLEVINVDVFDSEQRIALVATNVDLPEPLDVPSPLPQLLVINFQVQRPGSTVFHTSGGPGYSMVLYLVPSAELISQVRQSSQDQWEPAVKLLCKWFETHATDSEIKERLKAKVSVLNPETCRIPAWALKYNGHSCMLTKSNKMARVQGRSVSGRSVDVLECDIDLREWSLLCRQGVNSILPIVNNVDFSLALMLQGETDDELPERVLALVRLSFVNLDPSHCEKW